MRKVIRAQIAIPNNLANLTDIQKTHLLDHTKISSSIYRHINVIDRLTELYYDKCYICECDVSNAFEVEHYKPKKEFPELGYTWGNLHKSCRPCNLAKEANNYKLKDSTGKVIDILLLDPSDASYNIEDYIYYDINAKVQATGMGTDPLIIKKAKETAKLLNSREKHFSRQSTLTSFLHVYIDKLSKHKERLIEINRIISTYTKPLDDHKLSQDKELFIELDKINVIYLKDDSKYSTSTRSQLIKLTTLNYEEVNRILISLRSALQ